MGKCDSCKFRRENHCTLHDWEITPPDDWCEFHVIDPRYKLRTEKSFQKEKSKKNKQEEILKGLLKKKKGLEHSVKEKPELLPVLEKLKKKIASIAN